MRGQDVADGDLDAGTNSISLAASKPVLEITRQIYLHVILEEQLQSGCKSREASYSRPKTPATVASPVVMIFLREILSVMNPSFVLLNTVTIVGGGNLIEYG